MQKIILIGFGPDPTLSNSRSAFSLRTTMFERGLRQNGFEVEKILIHDGKHKDCFNINSKTDRKTIHKLINKSDSKFVIASGFAISDFVSKLNLKNKYLIHDLNGWTMAEMQAKAFSMQSDVLLSKKIKTEKRILKSGDFFTTVSKSQQFAIYGELSQLGKINSGNFGKTVVSSVANKGVAFKREKVEKDNSKFKIIWLGGFNNWADEKTLFEGIQKVMQKFSFIELIVTGGAISGVNDSKYAWFIDKVNASEFVDRFKLLNWANAKDVPSLIMSSDLGINCDLNCLETSTGARNRINELVVNGVPVISSRGSEVAKQIESSNLGATFESGNANDLAEKIEIAVVNQQKIWARNCQNYTPNYNDFSELVEFIKKPFKSYQVKKSYFKLLKYYIQSKGIKDILRKLGC